MNSDRLAIYSIAHYRSPDIQFVFHYTVVFNTGQYVDFDVTVEELRFDNPSIAKKAYEAFVAKYGRQLGA